MSGSKVRMVAGQFAIIDDDRARDHVAIYPVDEHGCFLHKEPVCIVPMKYHAWFIKWLCGTETPVEFPEPLEHVLAIKK